MTKVIISVFLSVFLPIFLAAAETGDYQTFPFVRNFEKTDYKAGTQNWDITESGTKIMYFANNGGLLEFDGVNWTLVPISNWTNVRSVLYDRDSGRIYAGAFGEFGYYSYGTEGTLGYTSLMDIFPSGGGLTDTWKIVKSKDGIYFHDDYNIYVFREDRIRKIDMGGGRKINAIAAVGRKIYFSAFGKGLFSVSEERAEPVEGCEELADSKICAIISSPADVHGALLLVTEFDGVYLYSEGELKKFELEIDGLLRKAQVFCAVADGDVLAVGTVSDGVFIVNLETGDVTHLNTFSGLQNNAVLSMFFDLDGNLWLGLDKGIDYVLLNTPEKSIFMTDRLFGTGYASAVSGGRLYLGTNQGLYYLDGKSGHNDEVHQVSGIKGQVWCLEEIDGTLFCGHDHGLFSIEGDRAVKIDGVNGIWKIMKNPFVHGEIIGCSYDGLFTLSEQDGKWIPSAVAGFDDASSAFEPDRDGRIWLHHWIKGLFRLTLNDRRDSVVRSEYFGSADGFPTERNNMTNMYDGRIVFSSEGGYYVYDEVSGRAVPYTGLNKLFSKPPVAAKIEESPFGDVLFLSGTMQTLARRKNGSFDAVDSISLKLLQDKRIPGFDNITWIDRDNFVINTEIGFSWIDLDKISSMEDLPKGNIMFRKISVVSDGRDSLIFGPGKALPEAGNRQRIRYRNNSLSFSFVYPQYSGKEAVRYSWILEGHDKAWSPWGGSTIKDYAALPSGNYTFRVRAKNMLSSDISETAFPFSVLPPWYLSKASVLFYVIFAGLCIYLLLNRLNAKAVQRAEEVERQKEEEMRVQQARYEEEAHEKEMEIVKLRNMTLEADLKHKSQDLADSAMNLIRKNEILIKIKNDVAKVQNEISENDGRSKAMKRLQKIQADIRENIAHDDDWRKFEHNFDMVYENYLKRLKKEYPRLTAGDMKLCAYLKMNLSSKDMASMMNMSVRSVEMARYRLRQKMGLVRETNLSEFLQNF